MTQQILGQILKGRYQLTEPLSAGGMGAVYKGVDTELFDRPVAVKLLHQHLAGDEKIRRQLQRRFAEEARVSTLLGEHPLIIKILDYGLQGEQPYLVMEYLAGRSLGDLMQAGPVDPQRVAHLGRQICAGLYHAHSFETEVEGRRMIGVVHRDIKPSNIFVLQDKALQETIKILDFGIAKVLSDASMALGTQTTGFLGTARYASPEQMRGEELDVRSDIYSLGIVLYRMVVGVLPISPKTDTFAGWYQGHHRQLPRPLEEYDLPYAVPQELSQTIMACLEKEPSHRPQTMHAVGQGLAAVLSGAYSTFPSGLQAPAVDSDPIFSANTLARIDAEAAATQSPTSRPDLTADPALAEASPTQSPTSRSEDLTQTPTAAPTDHLAQDPPNGHGLGSGLSQASPSTPLAPASGSPSAPAFGSEAALLPVTPVAPIPSPSNQASRSTDLEEDRGSTLILTEAHPVEESDRGLGSPPLWELAVLGVPDDDLGEVVVAVVQPARGMTPGPELEAELTAHLRERIAGFKVPKRWVFVDELPRTATGKLQKHRIREALLEE